MFKSIAKSCVNGALIGVALSYLAAILTSLQLNLGYFLPYLASLPEQVGGEMNAVMFQAGVCALLGAGAGAAWRLARWKEWTAKKRVIGSAASIAVAVIAAGILAIFMINR